MRSIVFLYTAVVLGLIFAAKASAQTDFFWSFADLGQGAVNSDAHGSFSVGTSGSLFLYYSTANQQLDTGESLNITVSNSGVIEFIAAETFDFDIQVGDVPIAVRWGDAFGPAAEVTADSVTGLTAFTVTGGTGIIDKNTGPSFFDQGYDSQADAFLFGKVDFNVIGTGKVDLFTETTFPPCHHCFLLTTGDATIVAVPEPTFIAWWFILLATQICRRVSHRRG